MRVLRYLAIGILCICTSLAIACDGCDCGNGTFGLAHCCVSNGDCQPGLTCQANLCEPTCDGCDCGNGTFGVAHCCVSNGDCQPGLTCQAYLCEPAVPSCSADFCNANNMQNCGTICFDGTGTEECFNWCLNGTCCNGGSFTPGATTQ